MTTSAQLYLNQLGDKREIAGLRAEVMRLSTMNFHDGDPWREPKPEPTWDSIWITIGNGVGGRR